VSTPGERERAAARGGRVEEIVFDAWTPMSFKRSLGNRRQGGVSWEAPTWVGDHRRRLLAYRILQSYVDNAARFWLSEVDQVKRDEHREYGDAALLRDQILAALVGGSQEVVVDLASDYRDPEEMADGDEPNPPDVEAAWELQEWLRDWAVSERLGLKLLEAERNAVGLGDAVFVLGWSPEKDRPRLRVFDPGFYFPVLGDGNEDDFPERVHLAWELDADQPGKVRVRRLTWELGLIAPRPIPRDTPALARALSLGELPELFEGDRYDGDGFITRRYPWNDEPVRTTCYFTDATWELDLNSRQTVDDMAEARATYAHDSAGEINRRDLMIDFVPVVHVPNTVALLDHYGRSSLATVLQVLDDLSNADTDLQAASGTTGTPPVTLSGGTLGSAAPAYRPGQVWELGEGGRMDVLDTSTALDALLKYVTSLLKRASVNARVPEAVLGRVDASDVPSGLALALSFGPLDSMVGQMRLVRDEKHPLVLKFAHRIAVAGRARNVPATWYDARLELGSYLPADVDGVIKQVTQLLEAGAISLETAVMMLMQAGLPIEDAVAEVRRIEQRDFEGAEQLADATGSEDAARDYLGLEPALEPPPPPPELQLPPAPVPPEPVPPAPPAPEET
jgi:hypothetical protein